MSRRQLSSSSSTEGAQLFRTNRSCLTRCSQNERLPPARRRATFRFRLALLIVVVAVFLGSFDEWPGHLHLVLPRIGPFPIRCRVPRYMVQEVRVDCVGFVVL